MAVDSIQGAAAFCAEFDINEENCYEFSKEAVLVWTMQCWSRWRDRNIRVNAISPSVVETPIFDDFTETVGKRAHAASAIMGDLPALGQPDEIAAIIGFLCSDDSRRLNGISIPVDGGMVAARTSHRLGFAL